MTLENVIKIIYIAGLPIVLSNRKNHQLNFYYK